MGWFLLLVAVFVVISSLKKKKGPATERQPAARPGTRQPPPLSREEQVRRVREEIQRKIQARLGREQQAVVRAEPRTRVPPVLEAAVPPPLPPMIDETLERQRQLAERIRELEVRRARVQQNTVTADSLLWDTKSVTAQMGPRAIRAELRDGQGVRRAMLLREVLWTPVGLR